MFYMLCECLKSIVIWLMLKLTYSLACDVAVFSCTLRHFVQQGSMYNSLWQGSFCTGAQPMGNDVNCDIVSHWLGAHIKWSIPWLDNQWIGPVYHDFLWSREAAVGMTMLKLSCFFSHEVNTSMDDLLFCTCSACVHSWWHEKCAPIGSRHFEMYFRIINVWYFLWNYP